MGGVMEMMRGNVTLLAERDLTLHNLNSKSNALQGTTGVFNRRARQLRWESRWKEIRFQVTLCMTIVWIVLLYIFREKLQIFFSVSSIVFIVLYVAQRCVRRHWLTQ